MLYAFESAIGRYASARRRLRGLYILRGRERKREKDARRLYRITVGEESGKVDLTGDRCDKREIASTLMTRLGKSAIIDPRFSLGPPFFIFSIPLLSFASNSECDYLKDVSLAL
ncbi:hypothetical protein PUN28_007853 [Cardiocondyla obscurior]|uniref:Uncharacterized protein n=1 Tax=Cardiocondyla obscurior TaxID=286306 RepID=A0AAW2FUL9_9HYME